MMRRNFTLLVYILFISSLQAQSVFKEVSASAGINHAFVVDIATFGGGATVFDYNNDGFEDIYLTGGVADDVLYHNNGDGTFTDVMVAAGLEASRTVHTQGAAAADVNRDGYKDLIVTSMYDKDREYLAPNLLFINNGDGTFTEQTKAYGLEEYVSNSQGATFGDINADGYPDLYIANYISSPPQGLSVFNEQTITENYNSAKDFLFINAGGQYFLEVSDLYGMNHDGFGFEGAFTDWDNDQDLDLMIANDFGFKARPNIALQNNFPAKNLSYEEIPLQLNFGMNGMGIAAGDYNSDGWMDYYVTNISASLFAVNQQGTTFDNAGGQAGVAITLIDHPDYRGVPISWGANFFDYDHDADLDLFVNNGALNPNIRLNHNFFFELTSFGRYQEVSRLVDLDHPGIGRGSAIIDYDNDGDMDLIVVNQVPRDPSDEMPVARTLLYRNDRVNGNWLKVKLEGVKAEKDGIGSRIEVRSNDQLLIREIEGGSSHLSHNSTIAHFGLGDAATVESIIVKWVGGKTQEITNVPVNQQITITETEGSIFEFEKNNLKVFPTYFDSQVILEYELAEEEPFTLSVYDIQGRIIQQLSQQDFPAQTGLWQWNVPKGLAAGVYVFQLRTADETIARRAIKK